MNFNLKLKKIRTFQKMTQKELSEKIGLTDQHRIIQYEKGVRVPKKDLVDKMTQALDVNPYILYDTAGRDASEMMELLFWLDEFNPSVLHDNHPHGFFCMFLYKGSHQHKQGAVYNQLHIGLHPLPAPV